MCSNKVEVDIEIEEPPKAVESVIETLVGNESNEAKIYYPLLMKFDKLKPAEKTWDLTEACKTVMSSCLFKPPTVGSPTD